MVILWILMGWVVGSSLGGRGGTISRRGSRPGGQSELKIKKAASCEGGFSSFVLLREERG